MIVKIKLSWKKRPSYMLVTKGRTYEHETLASAKAQEAAINLAKARRAGHRIPKRPRQRS